MDTTSIEMVGWTSSQVQIRDPQRDHSGTFPHVGRVYGDRLKKMTYLNSPFTSLSETTNISHNE